jgi:hypothetical protein
LGRRKRRKKWKRRKRPCTTIHDRRDEKIGEDR